MRIFDTALFTSILIVLIFAQNGSAQPYVRVTFEKAAIYAEPDSSKSLMRFIVQRGDIFEIIETREGWIKVQLFSGEARYIRDSTVSIVFEPRPFPSDPSVRKKMCEGFENASRKASREALSEYPDDFDKNDAYRNLLFDKYMLNVFRKLDIPAIHLSKLVECSDDSI